MSEHYTRGIIQRDSIQPEKSKCYIPCSRGSYRKSRWDAEPSVAADMTLNNNRTLSMHKKGTQSDQCMTRDTTRSMPDKGHNTINVWYGTQRDLKAYNETAGDRRPGRKALYFIYKGYQDGSDPWKWGLQIGFTRDVDIVLSRKTTMRYINDNNKENVRKCWCGSSG